MRPRVLRAAFPLLVLLVGVSQLTRTFSQDPAPYSNVRAEDYVGPEVCAECHQDNYGTWRRHRHSTMNANVSATSVVGDFSGVRVSFAGGEATFERLDGTPHMTVTADGTTRRYRVTRTVGSRYQQMYMGFQIEGPEPKTDPVYELEGELPFGYWVRRKTWTPVFYHDSGFGPEFNAAGERSISIFVRTVTRQWSSCMSCHNTFPYQTRLHNNPGKLRYLWGFHPTTISQQGARDGRPPTPLQPKQLVTVGISCETCHFGGREHAVGGREMRFVPSGPGLEFPLATPPFIAQARQSPFVINSICSQCHSGPAPLYPNGASMWNSKEASDLRSGACSTQIKCTDCHDPHVTGAPGGSADAPEHLAACLSCHEQFSAPAARREHARHSDASGVTCLDCHMPRMVQGLDTVTRSHRISSPTDVRMLEPAAPNACNLCHLDKPIRWTLDELQRGWGVTIPRGGLAKQFYGEHLEVPVGVAWLGHKRNEVRLVATGSFARSPQPTSLARVVNQLRDREAVNRMFALFALDSLLKRKVSDAEFAPMAAPAQREAQVRELERQLRAGTLTRDAGSR